MNEKAWNYLIQNYCITGICSGPIRFELALGDKTVCFTNFQELRNYAEAIAE